METKERIKEIAEELFFWSYMQETDWNLPLPETVFNELDILELILDVESEYDVTVPDKFDTGYETMSLNEVIEKLAAHIEANRKE